jgi:hypothetical protein
MYYITMLRYVILPCTICTIIVILPYNANMYLASSRLVLLTTRPTHIIMVKQVFIIITSKAKANISGQNHMQYNKNS